MSTSLFRRWASRLLASAVLAMAAMAPAQASIVVGVWDPAYDPVKFPGLGWRGRIVVDVPDTCLTVPQGVYSFAAGPCAPNVVLEAIVELYDVNQAGQPTLETLDFTVGFFYGVDIAIASPGVILGVDVVTGTSIVPSTIPLAQYLGESAIFSLDFDVNLLTGQEVILAWFTPSGGGGTAADAAQIPPQVTFFVVPEPATGMLAGTALLALGWGRRLQARAV